MNNNISKELNDKMMFTSRQIDAAYINSIVDVDDEDEAKFEQKLAKAKELFESMAGWCTMEEGHEWFKGW